ncbi:MAG: hypothetical protein GX424_01470 [Clostridiales bacterium]|nr:hypothetical protein [Clostridiales bacterium]
MDESFIIYIGFYVLLIFTDLIPDIRKKDKKSLWIFIPVFIATLTMNIMSAAGFSFPSINQPIIQILKNTLHM